MNSLTFSLDSCLLEKFQSICPSSQAAAWRPVRLWGQRAWYRCRWGRRRPSCQPPWIHRIDEIVLKIRWLMVIYQPELPFLFLTYWRTWTPFCRYATHLGVFPASKDSLNVTWTAIRGRRSIRISRGDWLPGRKRTDKVMCGGRFAPKSNRKRSAKTVINRHGATDSIILPLGRGRAILSGPVLALGHMRVGPFPIQQYKDGGKQYI